MLFSAASDFAFPTRHSHHRASLPLWLSLFILSGAISLLFLNSILDTFQPVRLVSQCHLFLPFHTVCGVPKARGLEWFAIPFLSELSTMPHLSWGTLHGMTHSFIELHKAVIHVIMLLSAIMVFVLEAVGL